MSRIYIAKNKKSLSGEVIKKIAHKLENKFAYADYREKDESNFYNYFKFNSLQIIYLKEKTSKLRVFSDKRFFISICGSIDVFKKTLGKNKSEDVFRQLADYYLNGKEYLINFLKNLSGQFAIFFYDKKFDNLWIANDKLGFYSAYYYDQGDVFVYSNVAESVIISLDKKVLNYDALADYLSLGIVQNQETFCENVFNLSPATILFKKKHEKSKRVNYHSFVYDYDNYEKNSHLDVVNEKLKDSVLGLYRSQRKNPVVCLTGGFDTRLMNLILVDNGENQKVVFTQTPLARVRTEIDKIALKEDERLGREFARENGLEYELFEDGRSHEDRYRLHGLFGGEIFGAEAFNFPKTLFHCYIPSSSKSHFFTEKFRDLLSRDPIEEFYKNVSLIDTEEWEKKIFIYKARLASTTFFNNLEDYGNPRWKRPSLFFNRDDKLLYPYIDADFLTEVFKIPFRDLYNHGFYIDLLTKYYKKYCRIGILHGKKRLFKVRDDKKPNIYLHKKLDVYLREKKSGEIENTGKAMQKRGEMFVEYLQNFSENNGLDKFFFNNLKRDDFLFSYRVQELKKWLSQNNLSI